MKAALHLLPLACAGLALAALQEISPLPSSPLTDGWGTCFEAESVPQEDWRYWRGTPYSVFVDHFSAQRTATETYLYDQFKHLYANQSLVITQDRSFNLLGYRASAASEGSLIIKPMEGFESISKLIYAPPERRRDGDGRVLEAASFAGYEVAWKEHEFKAIVASWSEGFNFITQWHIIGETREAAEELVHTVGAWSTKLKESILVFDHSFWNEDHALWLAIQSASWKDVILAEDLKQKVQHDYRSFFKSEKIYKDLNVPWKRGLIFLGPPGNGKTISLKAIMKEVTVPILYVKSLHRNGITGADGKPSMETSSIFLRARREAPCVLVMEDLDSLITDQNRSFFLNEVDGLEDNDGLLLIGTTNHFERLDPALSNRPSRFDRKYNFPNPNRDERRAYAVYWQKKLSDNNDIEFPDSLVDEVADRTEDFSFAYLKEAFVSTLLTLAGREDALVLPFREVLLDQIKTLRESLENGKDQLSLDAASNCGSGGGSDMGHDFGRWGEDEDRFHATPHDRLLTTPRRVSPVSPSTESCAGGSKVCLGYRDDGTGKMTRIQPGETIPTGGKPLTGEALEKALERMHAAMDAEQEAGTSAKQAFVVQQ